MKQSLAALIGLPFAVQVGLLLVLGACTEKTQETVVQVGVKPTVATAEPTAAVEKGMFFKPELNDFMLHNEYDDDGDGDGVNETHVRRYINKEGDTAFSMTTGDRLWAWSLDTKGGDDTDIHKNFVILDSNCDGVFDERYSLNAEFHVPGCLAEESAGETREGA